MPTQDWGVYPDSLTRGTEVSSTSEGRHITAMASELNHGTGLAVVTKGYPVVFGTVAGNHGVGIAFNTEVAGTDLISVDTEGIWNLQVQASDDLGNSLVTGGDPLFINTTTCVISKIRNNATQIPFGYALGQVNGGDADVIAVKVHWDPRSHWLEDMEHLYFGDLMDVNIRWDQTDLVMLPLVNDTGAFRIGNGTLSMDFQVFGNTAAYSMLWDSSVNTLDIVSLIAVADNSFGVTTTDTGTHTGAARAIHAYISKTAGAITGAGELNAVGADAIIGANVSHAHAYQAYTAISGTPTIGDMSAYSCYCDNLGATAANVNEYECVNLNIDSTNRAAGSAQGNSFFRMYSHGANADQYFVIPDLQGATYLLNWPAAIVTPVSASAAGDNWTHRIACNIGGALRYIKLSDA